MRSANGIVSLPSGVQRGFTVSCTAVNALDSPIAFVPSRKAGAFSLTLPESLSLHSVCCSFIASLCFFHLAGRMYNTQQQIQLQPEQISPFLCNFRAEFNSKSNISPIKMPSRGISVCRKHLRIEWFKKLVMSLTMQHKSSCSAHAFHLHLTGEEGKN